MRRILPCLVALAACRFHDGVVPDDATAGGEMPIEIDAPVDTSPDTAPPTCMERWLAGTIRFGTPQKVGGLTSTAVDRDDFLTTDELTIYWSSERSPGNSGNANVWTASRTSIGQAFSNVMQFAPANTGNYESKLGITDDGLYFLVAAPATGRATDFYDARRTSTQMGFSPLDNASRLTGVNTTADELDPFITADGLHLYYAHTVTVTQNMFQQVYTSSRGALNAAWSTGVPVLGISDTMSGDADPSTSQDELVILFASNRPPGSINGNLWYATRASTAAPFGTPKQVPDIGLQNVFDGDPWLSVDGCRLYFASTRDAGNSNEIYVATATPP